VSRTAGWLLPSGSHDFADLMQAGAVAVLEARRGFDPSRASFQTYARARARGAMLDHVRRATWGGRSLDYRRRSLRRWLTSLEELVAEERWIESQIDQDLGPEARAELADCLRRLAPALAMLDEKSRYVLTQYFFGQRTLQDIARDFGVTESRVSQIKSAALATLRKTQGGPDGQLDDRDPRHRAASQQP
jgi:RNA polymerase sigma factor for flagellar operon FliA